MAIELSVSLTRHFEDVEPASLKNIEYELKSLPLSVEKSREFAHG